jgi:FAD/FMN-containing dehydrogenase
LTDVKHFFFFFVMLLFSFRSFRTLALPPRSPLFSRVTEADLSYFRSILTPSQVLTPSPSDPTSLLPYTQDWLKTVSGTPPCVLLPSSTHQLSLILAHCHRHSLAVVPQGGNTGLVGGSVPLFDEVVLSLKNMNAVEEVDEVAGTVVCGAGVVLENLENEVRKRGLTVPLDLASKGSCMVGGNVATNAGGLRLVRYGSLHGSVLGLEVVLADGTVVDGLTALRKDNSGYDVKQLFIGSEGTLGVISRVALLLPKAPRAVHVMFVAVDSYEDVQQLLVRAKTDLGEILSAFEFLDGEAARVVAEQRPSLRFPLQEASARRCPFFVLIETAGSNAAHDRDKLDAFLEGVLSEGIVQDGTLAADQTQAAAIWAVRESISESCTKYGALFKYDLSLPVAKLYAVAGEVKARVPATARVVAFGHLGDGNLHLNVTAPLADEQATLASLEPFVYDWTARHRGSISAEHGIGCHKVKVLARTKDAASLHIMRGLKQLLDPKGILNPYKVL